MGAVMGDDLWVKVLRFIVSLPALAAGLCTVCHSFRRCMLRVDCWQDQDVALQERQLQDITVYAGGAGWGRPFGMLSTWSAARTVRVGCCEELRRAQLLSALRAARDCICPEVMLLDCSFCEHHSGENVELPTPRKLTASRRPSSLDVRGGGLLLGNGPLPERVDGSRLFALRILSLAASERLDIGVTSLPPHTHFAARQGRNNRVVRFAEDLSGSWVVESSGLLVGSHAGVRIRDGRWDARRLRPGDELVLLVTMAGELALHLNGSRVASWRAQIAPTIALYAVVDLFEGASKVQMLPADLINL